MTDAEISRRLALAIGWDVLPFEDGDEGVMVVDHANQVDRYFDYRDPAVIWPIAEAFNCFPERFISGEWFARVPPKGLFAVADTAAKAVALAVIKAHEGSMS
jgi:hypothetical protein